VKPKKPKSHKKTKKKQPKEPKKTLDALSGSGTDSEKNNRGRKRSLPYETVTGRASYSVCFRDGVYLISKPFEKKLTVTDLRKWTITA